MNDFWKSFDIGFLLRSVFAGYLFIISFIVAAEYTELVFVLCFHNKEVIWNEKQLNLHFSVFKYPSGKCR